MSKKLMGFKKFLSKDKKKEYEVIIVQNEYSQRENDYGSFGSYAEEIFLPDSLKGLVQQQDIGKEFLPVYEVSNGKAYLVDYKLK